MKRRDPTDMAVIEAFAARLRTLRTGGRVAHGLAFMQAGEAAARAGISAAQWSRLERGRCDPSLTSMLRIQAALGLDSIEALLGPTPSRVLGSASRRFGERADQASIDDMSG